MVMKIKLIAVVVVVPTLHSFAQMLVYVFMVMNIKLIAVVVVVPTSYSFIKCSN